MVREFLSLLLRTRSLAEQIKQNTRGLVRDTERLRTELLTDLQTLQACRFLGKVRIDDRADTVFGCVFQDFDKAVLVADRTGITTDGRQGRTDSRFERCKCTGKVRCSRSGIRDCGHTGIDTAVGVLTGQGKRTTRRAEYNVDRRTVLQQILAIE